MKQRIYLNSGELVKRTTLIYLITNFLGCIFFFIGVILVQVFKNWYASEAIFKTLSGRSLYEVLTMLMMFFGGSAIISFLPVFLLLPLGIYFSYKKITSHWRRTILLNLIAATISFLPFLFIGLMLNEDLLDWEMLMFWFPYGLSAMLCTSFLCVWLDNRKQAKENAKLYPQMEKSTEQ